MGPRPMKRRKFEETSRQKKSQSQLQSLGKLGPRLPQVKVPVKTLKTSPTVRDKKQKAKIDDCSQSLCKICEDIKHTGEMFRSNNCTHSFCKDCIRQHLTAKIQENIIRVKCPDLKCYAILEPEHCRPIVPEQVFDRWENALCESLILPSQKFYCPFKDCSAMLVDDGGEVVIASECPNCHRLFCALCKVPWHAGMKCKEFQTSRGKEDDDMVQQLAKNKRWQRCPSCYFYIERTEGCNSMKCRCGYGFCYRCGLKDSSTHECPRKQII